VSTFVYLTLAAIAGALIGGIHARTLPYAPVACALAALIVAVSVSLPMGDAGPLLLEVAILPALAGALGGAVAMRLLLGYLTGRWASLDAEP